MNGSKAEVLEVDSITQECYGLAESHIARKIKLALESERGSFTSCESFSFAVGLDLKAFKSKLRLCGGRLHAVDEKEALMEFMGCFAAMRFAQKPKYCAARVKLWAPDDECAKKFETAIKTAFDGDMIKGILFGVHWAYMGGHGLDDVYIEEIFEDNLLDEAYPALAPWGGVERFVGAFLKTDESVLILQGVPGSGKTRLVRKVLAEMSRAAVAASGDDYGSKATALYTGDEKIMESDEIFARFITGEERAFVVEDADHMLRSRNGGNDNVHRFLAVADGIVRAGGRKVVFSTNLPNVSDVDDALVRPGRCFARVHFKELDIGQAKALGEKLSPNSGVGVAIDAAGRRGFSVAEVYAMAGKAKNT